MSTISFRDLFIVLLATAVLAGCSSNQPEEETMPEQTASESSMSDSDGMDAEPEPETLEPRVTTRGGKRVIEIPDTSGDYETLPGVFYFDFDQAIIKRAAYQELQRHAQAMAADRSLSVRLEGHADERGTREYNLALGERRANAVRAYLMTNGVLSSQLETISYGEEKPAVNASNEAAWSKNRRVELVYK